MTPLIVGTSSAAVLLILSRPRRALQLAAQISPFRAAWAIAGSSLAYGGLTASGLRGQILVGLGMAALLGAAWSLRMWPGGWLLIMGVALNGLAMTVYGRMPITPQVLTALQLDYPVATVLSGSKDIVAQGRLAAWIGDRVVLPLPVVARTTVWSIGDLLLLGGIVRAATARGAPLASAGGEAICQPGATA